MRKFKNTSTAAADTTKLQTVWLIAIVLSVVGAFLLASVFHSLLKSAPVDPSVLLPQYRSALSPKPIERSVFLVLISVIPAGIYCAMLFAPRSSSQQSRTIVGNVLPLFVATLFVIPFAGFNFSQSLMSGTLSASEHPERLLAGCFAASSAWLTMTSFGTWQWLSRSRGHLVSVVAWAVFALSMSTQILAFRLLGEASVDVSTIWWASVDSVIYSVSQITAGKTLLADMPSQYGLFAEFMAPIFRVIGLSVLKFTALCALLQVLSLGSVFYVAQRSVRDPAIKIAFGLALIMVTFETSLWLINIRQPYFQYWPIRFFWPALSVLAFYAYTRRPTLRRASVISLIGALGSLWNVDSGLMIELAFAVFLISKWAFLRLRFGHTTERARLGLTLTLLSQGAIFAFTVGATFVYMAMKADGVMHWPWLYEYQKVFYGLGFMMLPLPTAPHPWMAVIAVYLMGICSALASWRRQALSRRADLLMFVSFLGIGLFVYYEGRSHVLNLISACWPALLLSALLADHLLRLVRSGLVPATNIAPAAAALSLILFCSIPLLDNLDRLWADSTAHYRTRNEPVDSTVSDELRFIRAHAERGESCVILSKRQGIYYAATGLVSPIVGPGYAELLTTRDKAALFEQLTSKQFACVFLGIGKDSALVLGTGFNSVLSGYSIISTSAKGTMTLLRARTR
jgi:hypothetical protein